MENFEKFTINIDIEIVVKKNKHYYTQKSIKKLMVKQLDEKLKFQNDDLFITKRYFTGCTKILETQQGNLED